MWSYCNLTSTPGTISLRTVIIYVSNRECRSYAADLWNTKLANFNSFQCHLLLVTPRKSASVISINNILFSPLSVIKYKLITVGDQWNWHLLYYLFQKITALKNHKILSALECNLFLWTSLISFFFFFNIHGTVHRSMTSSNNQRDAA